MYKMTTEIGKKSFDLPGISRHFIEGHSNFMLFETGLLDEANSKSYLFFDPVAKIEVSDYGGIKNAFDLIEKYSKDHYLAGYFSYEMGYYFEKSSLKISRPLGFPLINLRVFKKIFEFDHRTGKSSPVPPGLFTNGQQGGDFSIDRLKFSFTKPEFLRKVSTIKEHIINGDTYQTNFTGRYTFDFSGSPLAFYYGLKAKQNVSYGALCKLGDEYVISLSPELFFKRDGRTIFSRPMKGTIGRGKDLPEDSQRIFELKKSAKESAGNLMIVDLIRNDLGRISETGSVKVSSLFEIERYNTLFQMTSTVTSSLKAGVTYFDIFKSLFPGGSVTGAPKIRTMQIIKELEDGDRGIYCGALGIIFPGKKAVFNLPIRTISIKAGKGQMGVGGGITLDSDPLEEYEECLLKAKFLAEKDKPFSVLETMLWDGKYRFMDEHLDRARNSAEYFGYYFDRRAITRHLRSEGKKIGRDGLYRIRLLLAKDGDVTVESSEIKGTKKNSALPVALSKIRTDPNNLFLRHKTTNRELYDSEYRRYSAKGFFDVIFLNARGEVTEGAISNIIIRKNGGYFTPPISSGLLPGILRGHLMKTSKVKEKVLFLRDLKSADKIFLCNSVRGLVEGRFLS